MFHFIAAAVVAASSLLFAPTGQHYADYGWEGYTIDSVTRVSSDFVVPNLYGKNGQTVAFWVGFGQGNPGIQQTGITGTVGSGYSAWWEMYPGAAGAFRTPTPPHPGDTMQMIVTFGQGVYTLTINDVTRRWHVSTRQASPNRESYGEVITEKYRNNQGQGLPLPDRMGAARFSYTNKPLGRPYTFPFPGTRLVQTGTYSFYVVKP